MLEWLIIGGGIHGVHIATKLVAQGGVDATQLAIVDPEPQLLARWRARTAATGMRYLRSPSVHHLAQEPWSLSRFAGKSKLRPPGLFAPPYDRPALALFDRHCDHVIAEHGLAKRHVQGRALACKLGDGQVQVTLKDKQVLQSRRVILAMGMQALAVPTWVPKLNCPIPIHHIFDREASQLPYARQRIAVVGGGISAAQVALNLVAHGQRVDLISRHAWREHQFDSDPGWLGPKYMKAYDREPCMIKRRELINHARHRGSLPPDLLRTLKSAIHRNEITWHNTQVRSLNRMTKALELGNGQQLQADRVLLATGFRPERPGGALVDDLIAQAKLPCAPCGFPVVSRTLAWSSRVYVSGPLAELELGPTARNISGARRAAERIMSVAREVHTRIAS